MRSWHALFIGMLNDCKPMGHIYDDYLHKREKDIAAHTESNYKAYCVIKADFLRQVADHIQAEGDE